MMFWSEKSIEFLCVEDNRTENYTNESSSLSIAILFSDVLIVGSLYHVSQVNCSR
jgi:hypothetical protein